MPACSTSCLTANDFTFIVRPPDAARIRIKVIYSRHEERVTRGQVKCVNNCKSRRFFTIILPSMWNYCEDSSYDHDDSVVIPITALHGIENRQW